MELFSSIAREDVEKAIHDLDNGVSHPFGPSTMYDLLFDGRRYPPKAVIALAVKHRSGTELIPADFEGGEDTPAFAALRQLGFQIVPKDSSSRSSVKFERADCDLFSRYPKSVNWAEVPKEDQEHFKSIRARLKQIAVAGLERTGSAPLKADVSNTNVNGRSPKDIWCCVFPTAARHKSYAFQVALIITKRGAELCFCLGSGDSQKQDAAERRELRENFDSAKRRLRLIDKATVSGVERQLSESWRYKESWRRDDPSKSEFESLSDWLEYATKDETAAASISTYLTPEELERTGEGIQSRFVDAVEVFRPFLGFPFENRVEAAQSQATNYWWLNANPNVWDFNDLPVGERDTYSSHNEKSNKRRIYKYFQEVKPGDLVVGYVTSPVQEVTAICKITAALHHGESGDEIEFEKIEQLGNPISYQNLLENPELAKSEPLLNNHQGSLFKLTKREYEIIRSLIDGSHVIMELPTKPYDKRTAMDGLFLAESQFDGMLDALKENRNVVLQGAPGVGKTFVAKRLAYALIGSNDPERVEMIQFHQSYSYEDFILGFRPTLQGNFDLKPGLFYQFCNRAQRGELSGKPYVFIIDEINRGNLSKIFGELMMLIEPDKRGKEHAIPLAYSRKADEKFYIPDNLYLIGTMNTADRSLALVDYALRRRFRFITLRPEFASGKFQQFLSNAGADAELVKRIVNRMDALNEAIAADTKNLGSGYQIGHSYFCPRKNVKPDTKWYRRVIESEIVPLIQEYWIDNEEKVQEQRSALLA